jgi:hypothetical protein
MVANASLATVDLFTALWFLVAVRACWGMLSKVTLGSVLLAGISAGLLAATKISAVLLVPVVMVMATVRLWTAGVPPVALPAFAAGRRLPGPGALAVALAAAVVVAVLALWACYLPQLTVFRAAPDGGLSFAQLARAYSGALAGPLDLLGRAAVFPEPWVHDLRLFLATTSLRRAYLGGEYSVGGWWHFFPVAWFLKSPVPCLLALLGAAAALAWGRVIVPVFGGSSAPRAAGRDRARGLARELVPLGALAGVYVAASMTSGLNIGLRHLLPVFPPLFILAGAAVFLPVPRHWRPAAGAAFVLWSAAELWSVRGQYLSYFNAFAGGPREGHRHLVDSSFEWGQDLPALEVWLDRRRVSGESRPVYLSYFGNADLRRFRLGATVPLPQFYDLRAPAVDALKPGTYVISATMLRSVYGPLFGPWRPSHEARFQELRGEHARVLSEILHPGVQLTLKADEWERIRLFEWLRFNRLCAYLRGRGPDSRVTHGLLVYELSGAELAVALDGPPAELASEDAVLGSKARGQESLDFLK